ncbi:MAG: NADH-quinone oxidoreductase subunit A [Planctomycetota bacterium]|jgi:NADH-quinone oxidoreductase subunit A
MKFDYLNVLIFTLVGLAFVFANTMIGSILRPKRKTTQGLEVYECGEETIGAAWIQFDIRYYTVALIYVIFAVEITFLFPWAMVFQDALATEAIGLWAVAKGFMFVAILFFGLVAVWAKGDLDWVMSFEDKPFDPEAAPGTHTPPTMGELDPEDAPDASDDEGDEAA